jgi:hypothetical protein
MIILEFIVYGIGGGFLLFVICALIVKGLDKVGFTDWLLR